MNMAQTVSLVEHINQLVADWRKENDGGLRDRMVREGTRTLNKWEAQHDDYNDEWVVVHYVGGEDYEVVFSYHDRKAEAQRVVSVLNHLPKPLTHTYYRTWEG